MRKKCCCKIFLILFHATVPFILSFRQYVGAYIDHPKPLVALVNGPALGIAVTVLGMFDLVYASDKVRFLSEISYCRK